MFQNSFVQGTSYVFHQIPVRLVMNYQHFIGAETEAWASFIFWFKVSYQARSTQYWGCNDPQCKIKNPPVQRSQTGILSDQIGPTSLHGLSLFFLNTCISGFLENIATMGSHSAEKQLASNYPRPPL